MKTKIAYVLRCTFHKQHPQLVGKYFSDSWTPEYTSKLDEAMTFDSRITANAYKRDSHMIRDTVVKVKITTTTKEIK